MPPSTGSVGWRGWLKVSRTDAGATPDGERRPGSLDDAASAPIWLSSEPTHSHPNVDPLGAKSPDPG